MNSNTNKVMYHSLIIIIIITITSLVIKSNIDMENFSLVDKDIRNEYKKKIKTEKRERENGNNNKKVDTYPPRSGFSRHLSSVGRCPSSREYCSTQLWSGTFFKMK